MHDHRHNYNIINICDIIYRKIVKDNYQTSKNNATCNQECIYIYISVCVCVCV